MTEAARQALTIAALSLLLVLLVPALDSGGGHARAQGPRLPALEIDLGGRDRARLLLAAQLRATVEGAEDEEVIGTVAVPRLRPGIRATLLDGRLALGLTVNTSPVRLELIELWAEGIVDPALLRVRVGQWKIPFTRYRSRSFSELSFVDWARVVTLPFGAEHSIGIAGSGVLPGIGTRWDLGVFVGPPTRNAHGTGLATSYGERVPNLSDLGSFGLVDRVHPEIAGRVSHWLGGTREGSASGDGAELTLSVAGDVEPEPRRDLALRVAPEVRAQWGVVSGLVILYAGLAPIGEDALAPALFGALAELAVRPISELELALRFARTARTAQLLADARAYAAMAVAEAPEDEREATAARYARVGRDYAEQEVAFGVSWMIVGRALELQGDAGWLLTEGEGDDQHAWRLRLQVQIVL